VVLRSIAKRFIPAKLQRYLRKPWVIAQPQPDKPSPIDHFLLYAIVGTWMEADIIEATVSNAFAQGVDRVFLIDNESPDDTVTRAKKAGAEHVHTYRTTIYDEDYRIKLMNDFMRHTSTSSDADYVWWLLLDADEFPRPQAGGTLRGMLEALDRRFRVVGARFLNHYPSPEQTVYVVGHHPIDYQPLCEELKSSMCLQDHRKHSLIRWDRRGSQISSGIGFHVGRCKSRPLIEPLEPFIIHHFPFREEHITRLRMHGLFTAKDTSVTRAKEGDIAVGHMKERLKSLDAVYASDWSNVSSLLFEESKQGISLTDWRELQPGISNDVRRWYVTMPGGLPPN